MTRNLDLEAQVARRLEIGRWMTEALKHDPTMTVEELAHEAARTFGVPCTHALRDQARFTKDPFEGLVEEPVCAHESAVTADGHGSYCRFCGETLE